MSLFDDLPGIFTSVFSRSEVITVQPVDGDARDVTGRSIFRRAGMPVDAGGLDFVTSGPELHLAEADAADLDADASATVDGAAFTITGRYADGRGMVRLPLREGTP